MFYIRGLPTYPTEDTDRPYPEGFHQRGSTHPTEDTDRPYPEGFHQRGPTHPTEDTDRPYPEGFHQRGQLDMLVLSGGNPLI
jgi:hypothetical protein